MSELIEMGANSKRDIAISTVSAFRGRYLNTVIQLEEHLSDYLSDLFIPDTESAIAGAFRRILLAHRDISFQTKIELFDSTMKFVRPGISVTGLVKRLHRVRRRRNDLAHIKWNVISFEDDPTEVSFQLTPWRSGRPEPIDISMPDQKDWIDQVLQTITELKKLRKIT